jgi:type II secretory pathway component PulM
MTRLHARALLAAERLGWPGVVGLGLAAFAAGFYLSTVQPGQARVQQLRTEMSRLESRSVSAADDAPATAREQLDAFYGFFPPAGHTAEPLGRIFSVARKQGLSLERGEYRTLRESTGGLVQFQLMFPLRGTYPQVRRFVAAALARVPHLALDTIQFERSKVGEAVVNAKVTFVLYLGGTS